MTLAALPMYDWPEARAETDGLWRALAERLGAAGFPAPERLSRDRPARDVWADPALLFSQTCGLPYVAGAARATRLICTPVYEFEGCGAGRYASALVARPGPVPDRVRFAANGPDSLSGWAAPLAHLGEAALEEIVWTGAHRASIMAVLEGRADLAAIDAVAWAFAKRYDPAAGALQVVGWTDPLPALPFVTSAARPSGERAKIRAALVDVLADAESAPLKETLGLARIVAFADTDYDPVRETARLAASELARRPDLQQAVANAP